MVRGEDRLRATLLSSGRYEIGQQLGAGGMATAYLAHDRRLGMDVVIKVPHASLLNDASFARRFQREIKSLVQLSHPRVCRVLDVGEHNGLPFAVLQYLSGGTLEDCWTAALDGRPQPLSLQSLTGWLSQIAEALDYVHSRGYVHRDVKPANILFDEHGYAYLSDFGVAKVASEGEQASQSQALTGTGLVMGTLEYMAPELLMGETVDGRVDQYALAVTVFELLAARHPFQAATPAAVIVQQTMSAPPDIRTFAPNVPRAQSAAIARALGKKPDDRFPTCRAFAEALLAGVSSSPSTPLPIVSAAPLAQSTSSVSQPSGQTVTIALPNCPQCGTFLKLSDSVVGKRARCPRCKTPLTVLDVEDPADTDGNGVKSDKHQWKLSRKWIASGTTIVIVALVFVAFQPSRSATGLSTVKKGEVPTSARSGRDKARLVATGTTSISSSNIGVADSVPPVTRIPNDGQSANGSTATADLDSANWGTPNDGAQAEMHSAPENIIYDLGLNPNGEDFATANLDGTIRIFDADTGALKRTLTGHGSRVRAVEYNPAGTIIASRFLDPTN